MPSRWPLRGKTTNAYLEHEVTMLKAQDLLQTCWSNLLLAANQLAR
jgi:hypothetical protein